MYHPNIFSHTDTAEGSAVKLREIQTDYGNKYNNLSKEDKDELIEEFKSIKKSALSIHCPTTHARIQDVANVVWNMELLVRLPFSCWLTKELTRC